VKKLYRFSILILDDDTFSPDEMHAAIDEALAVHLEAIGIKVTLEEVHAIIEDSEHALAEA